MKSFNPNNYVPTDNENVDDEEYKRINKEMYDDVNVELKYKEPANEEKGDEEMTHAENVNAEYEEVSQEVAGDQVKDDAQTTVTAAPATQKTEVLLESSFISSDYATKFLNFENIPLSETEIISMIDIKVQHEDLKGTTLTATVPDSETPFAIHLRVSDLEKEIKELKNVDHSLALRATIKYEVLAAVKEYLGTSLDDALYKVLQRHTADLSKEHSIPANVVEKLKQKYKPQKSAEDIQKHKALYHALIESILEDEDAMDKGVVDKSKKIKPDDTDRDEGPPAGPDQRLKRKKTGKETEPSKKAMSTRTSKGTTKSQPKSTG
ncbi:hypothetical protein Tco_1476614 [Tanacetum coccineum]